MAEAEPIDGAASESGAGGYYVGRHRCWRGLDGDCDGWLRRGWSRREHRDDDGKKEERGQGNPS